MNQTDSRRKAEGSGVGILCEKRPATSASSAASALGEPRLRLSAYLTAPDITAVVAGSRGYNRSERSPAARNLRGSRKTLTLPKLKFDVYGGVRTTVW